MFDAGLTIFDVQQRLGHHSPVITQEVYTHLMRHRYETGKQLMNDYIAEQLSKESGQPAPCPRRSEHDV